MPTLGGGGSSSSRPIRSSELCETLARSKVPSTEKCSEFGSGLISGDAANKLI